MATCQVRHLMLEVRNAIAEVLDNTSLTELRSLGPIETLTSETLTA
jgi:DNA-binding IscR family transcriptional regulator